MTVNSASKPFPKRRPVERAPNVTSFSLSKTVSQLKGMVYSRRAVLRAIVDRYPNIYPSIATLAEDAGYGTTVTRESLREFEEAGIIDAVGDKRGGRGKSEQYTVNVARILDMAKTQRVPLTLKRKPNVRRRVKPTSGVAFIPETQRNTTVNPTPGVAEHRSNKELQSTEKENREAKPAPRSLSNKINPIGQDKTPAEKLAAYVEALEVSGGVI